MSRRTTDLFDCIRTQGGLLPSDFLARIADPAQANHITGLAPADYHLAGSQKITEAINRSWNTLQGYWQDLKARVATLPDGEGASGITRDLWLLPLFQELGYGRLHSAPKLEIEERQYPISHLWGHTPIHLLGVGIDLDRTTKGAAGAARMSPHSMMQEFLNRSEGYLWAILANGYKLRLLRDNATLTRQAFVEFDLFAIFEGEAYSDFVLLWMLCHQSRVEGERPESCILEKWTSEARQNGVRLLDGLRKGVEQAIEQLGAGFLAHPNNHVLKERLRKGELSTQDYYRQILRQVYRFLFLFVAEDRELLLRPDVSESANAHYRRFYSTRRLRQLAERHGGTRHGDLWELLKLVTNALGSKEGCPALGLPALGSFLWRADDSTPDLINAALDNRHLLDAIRALATVRSEEEKVRRIVDYRNLGPEELGSVYESLLELHPEIHAESAVFKLNSSVGSDRKTTGSYYTPDSLVQCLLDSALEPVVKERLALAKTKEAKEKTILSLRVCDPACGSGHFLLAAAHRLGRTLAAIRSDEDEPSPLLYQHALRDVISRCIYGVDLNPMAVELCKITLWLEAIEPGKPLSFLDHHIQCGNSLLGATPALMAKGIPDEAFEPIEGDDKKYCSNAKRENKKEAKNIHGLSQGALFDREERPWEQLGNLATGITQLSSQSDDSLADVQAKEQKYAELVRSTGYEFGRQLADAWCGAFVWRKCAAAAGGFDYPITNDVFARLERNSHDAPKWLRDEIKRLAGQYQFFHWHLAFPEVFQVPRTGQKAENELCGWSGGFDLLLGNPPWDKIQPEEQKFFASFRPDIASENNAKIRKELIAALPTSDHPAHIAWTDHKRHIEGISHLLKSAGLMRFSGEGNLNTYRIFTELASILVASQGRVGMVVQTGLATDESGKELFDYLLTSQRLIHFFDFENRKTFFQDVHPQFRFCLVTIGGSNSKSHDGSGVFGWLLHDLEEIATPGRLVRLSANDLRLFTPTSRTCPVFVSERDLQISRTIYRNGCHVYLDESNRFSRIEFLGELFNLTRDAKHFANRNGDEGDEALPLYEAKYLHQFDHRFATVADGRVDEATAISKLNAAFAARTSKVVNADEVKRRLVKRGITSLWLLGFRDISSGTNERTAIMAVFPISAVGNSINLALGLHATEAGLVAADTNSFVFDYCCRQKVSGTHVNIWIYKQLPAVPLERYSQPCAWADQGQTLQAWLIPRVLELTYTAWDLEAFAQDCNWSGPPFRWDEERRFLLRCELDAAFFHLYGLNRDDAAYIMDTFPIVKRKDEEKHSHYRTKDRILELYDTLADCQRTGKAFVSQLNPAPASLTAAHRWNWEGKLLELPSTPRIPLPERWQYVVTVMTELLWQAEGFLPWRLLRTATDLLSDRKRLAQLGELNVGQVALDWLNLNGDNFDAAHRWDQLSGFCTAGKMRIVRRNDELVVELLSVDGHVYFPHVRFDARLALTIARNQPVTKPTSAESKEDNRVAELITA